MINRFKKSAHKRAPAALLAALMLLTAVFAGGCGKDEMSLVTAIMREPQKLSYEYEGGASLGLKFNVFEEPDRRNYFSESLTTFKTIEAMLDGVGFDASVKYSANEDNTVAKMEAFVTPTAFGGRLTNFTTGMWADVDLSKPDYVKEYFKLPKTLTAGPAWEALKGREYISLTTDDLNYLGELSGFDYGRFFDKDKMVAQQDAALELSKAFAEGFITLAGLLDNDSAYVQNVKTGVGKSAVYSVKVTDKGLKQILKSVVNMKKGDMKTVLKIFAVALSEYLNVFDADFGEVSEDMSVSIQEAITQLSQIDTTFDLFYPMIIAELNDFLDTADKMKLLGKDGITFDITFSKDGFITDCSGIIDLLVDLRGYAMATGERFSGPVSKCNVRIDFWNKFAKVNEDVAVKMPKVSGRNCITYSELMESAIGDLSLYMDSPFDRYSVDPGIYYDSDEYWESYGEYGENGYNTYPWEEVYPDDVDSSCANEAEDANGDDSYDVVEAVG